MPRLNFNPHRIKNFLITSSFFLFSQPTATAHTLLELKKCFINELSQYTTTTENLNSSKEWINKSLNNNPKTPSEVLQRITKNQKYYKKIVNKIAQKAIKKIVSIERLFLKENIHATASLKKEFKKHIHVIKSYLLLGNNFLKNKNKDFLVDSWLKLNKLLYPQYREPLKNISKLINNLKLIYFQLERPITIINRIKAVDYLQNLNIKSIKEIQLLHIINIHKIALNSIDDANAGIWRERSCMVNNHTTATAHEIPTSMLDLMDWLQTNNETNAIKLAADFHFKFVVIHPFADGNGCTAKLLTNLILSLSDHNPICIERSNMTLYNEYCKVIFNSQEEKNPNKFYLFLKNIIEDKIQNATPPLAQIPHCE